MRNGGLIYFVPRTGGVELLDQSGFGHARRRHPVFAEIPPVFGLLPPGRSPTNTPGTVFHWHGEFPQRVTWADAKCGGVWIGWAEGAQPGPGELFRGTNLTTGYTVRLLDGNEWQMPVVLPFCGNSPGRAPGLPHTFAYDQGGAIVTRVRPEYQHIVAQAERMLKTYEGAADPGPSQIVAFVADLLAVSYYVHVPELMALGLLDPPSANAAVCFALDLPERDPEMFGQPVPPSSTATVDRRMAEGPSHG